MFLVSHVWMSSKLLPFFIFPLLDTKKGKNKEGEDENWQINLEWENFAGAQFTIHVLEIWNVAIKILIYAIVYSIYKKLIKYS